VIRIVSRKRHVRAVVVEYFKKKLEKKMVAEKKIERVKSKECLPLQVEATTELFVIHTHTYITTLTQGLKTHHYNVVYIAT
jgi:hypothetical protein